MSAPVQNCIILFGDSITQGGWTPGLNGFGEQLTHVYARKFDVLNRGLSGYNTDWGLPVLKQCLLPSDQQTLGLAAVKLITIWFGANDACALPSPQHVPLERFVVRLLEMIDVVQSPSSPYYSPETKLILITPPPINAAQRPWDEFRKLELSREYANAVKRVGAERHVPVLDIWTAFWAAANENETALEKFFTDGLHLSGEGYQIVFDELMNLIDERYPELHPSRLRESFVIHSDIDVSNLEESLKWRLPEENVTSIIQSL